MSSELLDGVRRGDLEGTRAAINGMAEAHRRRLANLAAQLLREVRHAYVASVTGKAWPYPGDVEGVLRSVQVVALGTVSASELRKIGPWAVPPDDLAIEVLVHRPTSAAELVDAIADQPLARYNSRFAVMRSLVRAGRIPAPAGTGYVLAMINGLESRHVTVYESLKADPGLLDDEVWRLFEVEGGGDTSLATHDKYTPEEGSWTRALTSLSAEGLLSRERLLDASLAALRRDFAAFRAGWFSRFHETLQPTNEERRQRQVEYLALISSPIAATVSFAVGALVRAGGVSDEAADRLAPALDAKATATVRMALALLPRSARAGALVAEALVRAARASQLELIGFLEGMGALEPAVRTALTTAAPNVVPSLRERVAKLLGTEVEGEGLAPSACVSPSSTQALAGPVESVADLVELLAGVLERVDDAYDLERALDGVSRLCDRTGDTLRRLEPVAHRARKHLASSDARAFAGVSPRADMAGLVVAWASGDLPAAPPMPPRSVLGFLSHRVAEVAARAARGHCQPILSLPTAPGGAIDPAVLASRRRAHERHRIEAGEADAAQAALRGGEIPLPTTFRFVYGSELVRHTYLDETYTHALFDVRMEPAPVGEPHLDAVPALFIAALSAGGLRRGEADYCGVGSESPAGLAEAIRWVATVWPDHREVFYAKGAAELGQNIDWWEARWHIRQFLEPMLLPTEPLGEMARLLLALGLGAREPGERSLATDVFVAAVGEGRLDDAELGRVLARLYEGRVVKAPRVAGSLSDAGRVSREHARAVVRVIEFVLAGLLGPPPSNLAALLAVLSDSLAALGNDVRVEGARRYLSRMQGSGKGASLARALLSSRGA